MNFTTAIKGEAFDHKVAAIFETELDATRAADSVRENTSDKSDQVFVVRPGDTHADWELEPENRGIWRSLLRSHIWLAIAGAAVGLLVFLVLLTLGVGFVANNPVVAPLVLAALGTVLGMLAAGFLVTIRPDHTPYIVASQSALREGKTVVAVHAQSRDQLKEAQDALDKFQVKTVSTL